MRMFLPVAVAAVAVLVILSQIPETMKPGLHAAIIGAAAVALTMACARGDMLRSRLFRALACAVGLPILAWSLSNTFLLFAILLLWVPLIACRMGWVVPIYLYSLLLLPGLDESVELGSIKLFEFGVHDALGLGAAVSLMLNRAKSRHRLATDIPAVAVLLMFSAALSRDTTVTNFVRVTINVMLDLGLPYYILSRGVRTMDELRETMFWLGLGGMTLSALLLYEVWKGWPMYNTLYDIYRLDTPMLVKMRGGALRAGGPFVEPTSVAMVLATCILALWQSRAMFRSTMLHGLLCVFTFAGLTAPQSRGAWIGLFIAIGIALVFQGRIGRLLQAGAIVGVAGAILFGMATVSPDMSESLGMSGSSSETSIYRRQLFDRGLQEFRQSPLIGYSMPNVTARLSDLRQGEGIVDFVNTYIWILLISGLIGTAIFLWPFGYFSFRLLQYRPMLMQTPEQAAVGAFAIAALLMPMEMLFFTSFGGRPAFFVFAMFGFASALFRQYETSAAPTGIQPQMRTTARTS